MIVYDDCAAHLRSAGWDVRAPWDCPRSDEPDGFTVDPGVIEDERLTLADIGAYVLLTAGFDIEGDPKAEAELAWCHTRLIEFGLIEGEE